MRSGRRTQDYHFIKTERDALYYAAEIPSVAWGPPPKEVNPPFKVIVADSYTVTPKEQKKWFDSLWEGEMFSVPYLIIVSSDEDDSVAVSLGYNLMKKALENNRVQITGSAGIKEEETNEETVFMLTNLYSEAPEERIQKVRDWCYRHKDCFRILCSAGDPAVLVRRLHLRFNAVFSVESVRHEEHSFV